MRHKRVWLTLMTVLLASFFLSGCKLVRELEVDNVELNGTPSINVDGLVSVRVEDGKVLDDEAILDFFYGEDKNTLLEEKYITEIYYKETLVQYDCSKDEIQVRYFPIHQWDARGRSEFFMWDMDGMYNGEYYSGFLSLEDMENHFLSSFFQKYPEIGTDTEMREEAVKFCEPLAKACGYKDGQVTVCKFESQYDYVPDAYILIWQSVMNGVVLDSSDYMLLCIYVPEYQRIVYANAEQSLIAVEALEEVEPVSKEQAVAEAVRALGLPSAEGLTLLNMNLVYSPIYEKVSKDMAEGNRVIEPCWRIDYTLSEELKDRYQFKENDKGTIFINAVDGKVSK